MARSSVVFICSTCGYSSPRWMGRCPSCGNWNTLVETVVQGKKGKLQNAADKTTGQTATPIDKIEASEKSRIKTAISEFDRVLGGGFLPGQVVLLAGEPGIGKSTLLLQVAFNLKNQGRGKGVLYISGEESIEQVALRAKRIGVKSSNVQVANQTNVDEITLLMESLPRGSLVIVDSVQTLYTEDQMGFAGSVGQVRECSLRLTRFAKKTKTPLVLVGHVTKEGSIAGPKVLEHIVDTVLYLEGDLSHLYRMLRTTKNRYGSVDEVGVFEMRDRGMMEVKNPSSLFLSERLEGVSGSVVSISMEGTRPFAIEVQALTSRTSFGYPKRASSGISLSRVQILAAVLEKRLNLPLSNFDIYVNISGGLKIRDPAVDLALCLSIASSVKNIKVKKDLVAFGEIGLSGEVRKVPHLEKRLKEAKRLKFKHIIYPGGVKTLSEALRNLG